MCVTFKKANGEWNETNNQCSARVCVCVCGTELFDANQARQARVLYKFIGSIFDEVANLNIGVSF